MKKLCLILVVMLAIGITSYEADDTTCRTIADGGILDVANNPITLGYDDFGYNYQAHIFNGRYCDYDRVEGGDYCDVDLVMKWSDTWLSNKDCNWDGKLDRGYSCDPTQQDYSSACEGAWLTNHQSGKVEVDGKLRKWTYFVKIVMVPEGATNDGENWFTVDNILIGEMIWGAYAVIQRVSNDPSLGEHGVVFKSPVGPGFGKF
jgi:hypothetical protein